MKWTEIEIRTTPAAEDAITELYYTAGAQGVSSESAENLKTIANDPTINYIDDDILAMDPDTVILKGYFSQETDVTEAASIIKAGISRLLSFGIDPGEVTMTSRELEEEDWANSWKQYYKPVRVGEHIVIKPTWEDFDPEPEDIIIHMDPGMAFGTGTHETTQLCVAAMEQVIRPGEMVFDIGTGTGILAIIAAKLGAEKIIGIDLDPVAVAVAGENLAENGVADAIELREGDLVTVLQEDEQADVIVANILAEAIIALTGSIGPFLKPGGTFIASGIITERLNEVLEAFKANGFDILRKDSLGDWNGITAQYVAVEKG